MSLHLPSRTLALAHATCSSPHSRIHPGRLASSRCPHHPPRSSNTHGSMRTRCSHSSRQLAILQQPRSLTVSLRFSLLSPYLLPRSR
ncbi:hypothetical protein C8T65DRAFT_830937 [Cerioporus squamosus]|nr:hypothetical protein C8T65DRAFT_830937 [Cerioporus squamosus]